MKICGVQKLTLLDFPSHLACTVFLQGCNFACPFCHNSSLIPIGKDSNFETEEFFKFLESRKTKLDGVAITGGEPLLNNDIDVFIRRIKDMGFEVKLDTNGSNPKLLKKLIDEKLVDYVAMDVKNSFEKYALTIGKETNLNNIKESIDILINSQIDYEFRTTVVKEYHEVDDFKKMGELIKGAKKYFIQSFTYQDSVLDKNLHAMDKEELAKCLDAIKDYVEEASLRGID